MQPKYAQPEIERRWLVAPSGAPPLVNARARRIEDKYLSGGRLRPRKVEEAGCEPVFKLGKKYEREVNGSPQTAVNIYLSESEHETLLVLPGRSAIKTRYAVLGGSLDVYEHPCQGVVVFEVEFESAQAASAYTAPPFVGREVTRDAAYSGFALANAGR